jgi:ppGpp synthetase/RelA/SpoT-type nucleotidyltranferase
MPTLSHTQIDRLGDRSRKDEISEDDLRLLDEYRQSFTDAYQQVVAAVRTFGLNATGRPLKTTASIVDKLNRESIRLSQIQDIAGCRMIVANLIEQDTVTDNITAAFEDTTVFDRRDRSSHNYRAVHVVARVDGKAVEVQLRTPLQHAWAEVSEKLSDVFDASIKYGGGSEEARLLLSNSSKLAAQIEQSEKEIMLGRHIQAEIQVESEAEFFTQKQQLMAMLEEFAEYWRNK